MTSSNDELSLCSHEERFDEWTLEALNGDPGAMVRLAVSLLTDSHVDEMNIPNAMVMLHRAADADDTEATSILIIFEAYLVPVGTRAFRQKRSTCSHARFRCLQNIAFKLTHWYTTAHVSRLHCASRRVTARFTLARRRLHFAARR